MIGGNKTLYLHMRHLVESKEGRVGRAEISVMERPRAGGWHEGWNTRGCSLLLLQVSAANVGIQKLPEAET